MNSPTAAQKVLILLNPQAGGGQLAEKTESVLKTAFEALKLDGQLPGIEAHQLEFFAGSPETLAEKLDQSPEPYDRILAAGGDGTLANAITHAFPRGIRIGILPLGTGNRVAKTLEIPGDLKEALRIALTGKCFEMDVMCVNGRLSVLIADAGIGAMAMARTNRKPLLKRLLRVLAYPLFTVGLLITEPTHRFRLTTRHNTYVLDALGVAVVNGGDLAGYSIAPRAKIDDGVFDVTILAANNRRVKVLIQLLQQESGSLQTNDAGLITFQTDEITIETESPSRPVLVQIDGDASGTTPMHVTMAGKIPVLVAKTFNGPGVAGTRPGYSPSGSQSSSAPPRPEPG